MYVMIIKLTILNIKEQEKYLKSIKKLKYNNTFC